MTTSKEYKIIFLNQMAGPLFRELAEDLSEKWAPSILLTGHPDTIKLHGSDRLTIQALPEYNRKSNISRLVSWIRYFFSAFAKIWRQPGKPLLFIVSNPPFLGILGLFFKCIRNQDYIVLVYDIYPDLLISLGRIKNGLLAKIWRLLNRIVYQNAAIVFTISWDMADRLEKQFDAKKTRSGKVLTIPSWADLNIIKPMPKEKNWFNKKYGYPDKTTVLYSGNMGHTHDIESFLEVAKRLSCVSDIHFLFIGEGAKWGLIKKTIDECKLQNITLLPFQAEDVLPYSLTTGDIGIVAYQEGTEGCIAPSKTCYYMAAGLALLVASCRANVLSEIVEQHDCGINVKSKDVQGMVNAVLKVHNNPELLKSYKQRARKTAEILYSRKNTGQFAEAIKSAFTWQ